VGLGECVSVCGCSESAGVGVNKAGAESQRLGAGFQRVSAGDDVVHKVNALERERAMLADGEARQWMGLNGAYLSDASDHNPNHNHNPFSISRLRLR